MESENTNRDLAHRKSVRLNCELYAHSISPHLAQLYTGFALLAQAGRVNLVHQWRGFAQGSTGREIKYYNGLFVVLDDQKTFYYDTKDSYELDPDALEAADVYFKRSYLATAYAGSHAHKIHPLGFNYEVYPDGFDRYELQRTVAGFRDPFAVVRGLALIVKKTGRLGAGFIPTMSEMCSPPTPDKPPAILFSAHAWDPDELPAGAEREREERVRITLARAHCMELLKKEFGKFFYGGFIHSRYAVKNFPEFLLPDRKAGDKGTYIGLLRQYPICVATSGLHGSIGWKMAEYVAFSRAIVAEKPICSIPGGFAPGTHYLEFTTPEECVEQAVRLYQDRSLQSQMMQDNWNYYESFVRPDSFIWRTLMNADCPGQRPVERP